MPNHGLTQQQLNIIKRVLRPFAPKIDAVKLFGSRATGAYRSNSDIDLVIFGSLTEEDGDRLWTLFDACELPVKVDVNIYHLVAYPPLKDHMDAVMQLLFSKCDLQ